MQCFILKATGRCLRILRAVKIAMDPPTKLVYLKWRRTALREVENPSMMLLSGRPKNVSGICVAWRDGGYPPILAEVQGLGHFFWLWKSQENVHRLRLQPDEPSAGSFRKTGRIFLFPI